MFLQELLNNADQNQKAHVTNEITRRTASARERSPSNSSGQLNQTQAIDGTGTLSQNKSTEMSNLIENKLEMNQSEPPSYNEDLPSPPPTPSMTPASSTGDLQSPHKIIEEADEQKTDLVNEVMNEVKKTESN